MLGKIKFDYDSENDMLYLYNSGKKSKGSIEFGELVIDLEKKGEITGIEIFDASKYLSELTSKKISKKTLMELENASFTCSARKGTVIIKITLKTHEEKILAPLAIQDLNYKRSLIAR